MVNLKSHHPHNHTDWASPPTYPQKPDSTLCICLYLQDLNKAIIHEHTIKSQPWMKLPIALVELQPSSSSMQRMAFGVYTLTRELIPDSVQHPLREVSVLCTYHLAWRWAKMTSKMCMDQITYSLPGIIAIHNGICVYSHTPEEHDRSHIQLMQITTKNGIIFNSSKCRIRKPQISIYGAVFTLEGMKPDPSKMQAFQDLLTLNSPTRLQSFLGLINYLQPFIPSHANKTTFLCEQLAKWDWNPSTNKAFQHLKSWICSTLLKTTLMYYGRTNPVIVQTDTSEYGLGAAMIQDRCPIAFASRMLTDVKTRYANIKRECLSVCF